MRRQSQSVASFLRDEALVLDEELDYSTVEGLSHEMKERLAKVRPTTFVRMVACSVERKLIAFPQGAAQRLEGTTPGGLMSLYSHVKLANKRKDRLQRPLLPQAEAGFDDVAVSSVI